ncbi:MAG TPA: hypothetical protein RMH85_23430 [Polyangiaceae bacterium LLY-WYZ-15_(1-7)]|nr:acetyltransferase [Myxococcales bacterium]MAT27189.1 acetyltransferase [Sandaracinus sp.]HJK99921.1 hypothetical protein [Polyangiaceae bacterium LLY-WYZ-15_(1-7)]HJL11447.1 hypothetical protein [Polyangiaceae bacterium LLY-WYZ-15_(1-7)]HJL21341.1 hypothetical protein [Polyangiaceae bacterium LLY-WYZ-15_(1-7)]
MPRPSLALPTLGGAQLWADRRWRAGWRIQRHVLTGHHRLLDPQDRRHASGDLVACEEALRARGLPAAPAEVVVLLHGLGRSRRSMRGMEEALAGAGHTPVALDYPSTRRGLDDHVAQLSELLAHLEGAERVAFVTHSLGGIVTRGLLADARWPASLTATRVVMCAPPSRGAALARLLDDRAAPLFHAVMGPAGREVAAGPPYPPPPVPFLVIAGARGRPEGYNPAIPGDDDGIVAVDETRLEGMAGHVLVSSIHTFVMNHPRAQSATLRFLAGEPVER